MGRYEKILVAFDGSESGRNALKQAIRLAGAEQAFLGVLSVVPSHFSLITKLGIIDPPLPNI